MNPERPLCGFSGVILRIRLWLTDDGEKELCCVSAIASRDSAVSPNRRCRVPAAPPSIAILSRQTNLRAVSKSRRSSPSMDTSNSRGVSDALPTSRVGIKYLKEERLMEDERGDGGGSESSPPMDIRNPKGVTGALSDS
ncbi:hypothetical protein EVAR_52683_1 [Eumeta japonica]|uniref:Uncharacterized protein n=1 Tax=Eumeta variegata TaxID=151549 RepID=A0A4C1XZG1_EUMVA|nr:hypothetical protein EVAR_52683_1 [Eumeta japonica]